MPRLQINLLPDSKQQYVKQEHSRNLIISIATLISVICVAIFVIMLITVYGVQKKQISGSNASIAQSEAQLKAIPNFNQILTIQNQLSTLSTLHHSKHVTSRVFDYLVSVTPKKVAVGNISVDLAANTMQIDGTADSQHSVNVFIDTLKYTTYKLGSTSTAKLAFSKVVESTFGINSQGTSYSVSFSFDPALFSNANLDLQKKVIVPKLNVPKQTTTRSAIDDPSSGLFNGSIKAGQ